LFEPASGNVAGKNCQKKDVERVVKELNLQVGNLCQVRFLAVAFGSAISTSLSQIGRAKRITALFLLLASIYESVYPQNHLKRPIVNHMYLLTFIGA
jgi:hypothetical protein